jgi:hypothetical protein
LADVVDVRTRQRVVIEFLAAKGSSPMETDRHPSNLYGEDIMLAQTLVRCFKSSEKDVGDRPRSNRPATKATTEAKDEVDALIQDDRRITRELCVAVRIGKLAVMAIIRGIGYTHGCARWVTKMLAVAAR